MVPASRFVIILYWIATHIMECVCFSLYRDLFFITTLLIRERAKTGIIDIKQFFIRRAYRILPVAYVYLIVITLIFHESLTYRDLALAYTYVSSYAFNLPWVLSHLVPFRRGTFLSGLASSDGLQLRLCPTFRFCCDRPRTGIPVRTQ